MRRAVSVVIPCYNQSRYLGEAIESVEIQGYPELEVVVVDDGSTDPTPEVAARHPSVRYLRQQNRGLAEARNSGRRAASGEYLVFLDADDRLLPGALEKEAALLDARSDLGFVSGLCRFIDAAGAPLGRVQPPTAGEDRVAALLQACYIWMPGTVMYRRSALESAGDFDPAIDATADHDMYLRIATRHPVLEIAELVGEYRQHAASMSRDWALMLRETLAVLRKHGRDARHREACAAGRAAARAYYGRLLTEQADACLQTRQWRKAARALTTLLRLHPRGFLAVLRGPRTSNVVQFVVGPSAEEAAAGAMVAPPSRGHALKLLSLHPPGTAAGVGFNVQPGGESALAVACENATPGTVVVIDGSRLSTTYGGPRLLTALVPPGLYARPGTRSVSLRAVE